MIWWVNAAQFYSFKTILLKVNLNKPTVTVCLVSASSLHFPASLLPTHLLVIIVTCVFLLLL